MGIYASIADVRAEPEVPDDLDNAKTEALISGAEDVIDDILGPWSIKTTGPSSGRKIAQADVAAYQWSKLKRATVLLAVRLYLTPDLFTRERFESVSGPDFSTSGPLDTTSNEGRVGTPVMANLRASQLIQRGARAIV